MTLNDEEMKTLTLKDILFRLDNEPKLLKTELFPVYRCSCGLLPDFIKIDVNKKGIIGIDINISFYCAECLKN